MTEQFILGYLSNALGLSMEDLQKIASGTIILNKNPSEIKEFILENADLKITFLRNLYNQRIDFLRFASLFNLNADELYQNVDNTLYWLNALDFRVKVNVTFRRQLGKFLFDNYNYSYNQIANILNVAPTTIQTDKNYWI